MVNIFGWLNKKTFSLQADGLVCEKCQKAGTTTFEIYQEYMHVFWVPMFPLGKHVVSQCSNCGLRHSDDDLPKAYVSYAESSKAKAPFPIWAFTGTPVLIFALYMAYQDRLGFKTSAPDKSAQVRQCLAQLAVGQVYELDIGPPVYSPKPVKILIQIKALTGDSVTFVRGQMQRHLEDPLLSQMGQESFASAPETVSRADFMRFHLLDCQ